MVGGSPIFQRKGGVVLILTHHPLCPTLPVKLDLGLEQRPTRAHPLTASLEARGLSPIL
jgi:hypothetical protein